MTDITPERVRELLDGATPGPWEPFRTGNWKHDNYVTRTDLGGVAMQYALVWEPGDAEFIAAAPDIAAAYLAEHAARVQAEAERDEWKAADAASCELGGRYITRALAAEAERDGWKSKCEAAWSRGDVDGGEKIAMHVRIQALTAERDALVEQRDRALALSREWDRDDNPAHSRCSYAVAVIQVLTGADQPQDGA